jgi:hypothetical protein
VTESCPVLAESSIWGGKPTHVDLDLTNSAEEWAWVASELLNVNFGMWVDCCRFVISGLWNSSKYGSGICLSVELAPEFNCF